MKLHKNAVAKLIRIYDLYGGRKDQGKLEEELKRLDLTPYTQKENPKQQSFLVLTEELVTKPA